MLCRDAGDGCIIVIFRPLIPGSIHNAVDFPRIYRSIQEAEIKEFLQRVVTEQRCAMSVIYPIKEEKSC